MTEQEPPSGTPESVAAPQPALPDNAPCGDSRTGCSEPGDARSDVDSNRSVQAAYRQGTSPDAVTTPGLYGYASWGRRAGGYLIDLAPSIVGDIVFLVAYGSWLIDIATRVSGSSVPTAGLVPMAIGFGLQLAALAWQVYNRWIVAGRTGQSWGRRMMQTTLVGEDTRQPIGPLNAFLRDLVHILDGLSCVGYLWPLWDDKLQTLADKLMRTVVIDRPTMNSTTG